MGLLMINYLCIGKASSRYINFDDVLSCELAAYLPSKFFADLRMKISKGKSIRKKNMQVTISKRNCSIFDNVT